MSAHSGAALEAVVIGASAGGVETLQELLPALRPGFAAAVIVVLHVPDHSQGLLAQVLGRHCGLPVVQADDKEPLHAGRVYVAPPAYHLLVGKDRRCTLSQEEPVKYSRPSIDVTFETAAAAYGASLLGILLSGANDDGVAGMQAIHAAGGATWAQDPATARMPAMPQSAIAAGAVDQILSVEAMARRLRAIGGPEIP